MSRFRRFDIVEHTPSTYFLKETSIFNPSRALLLNPLFPSFSILEDELDSTLDLLKFTSSPPLLFNDFDTVTDLIQINQTPFHTSTRRFTRRAVFPELYFRSLNDRVSALELGFDRLLREEKRRKNRYAERKYTWTAEINSPEDDRKYKWTAEVKGEKKGLEKSYKLTAEIKRKGAENLPIEQTYTIKVSSGGSSSESVEKKKKSEKVKEKEKGKSTARIVEIEEQSDHGGLVLRQVGNFNVDALISSTL